VVASVDLSPVQLGSERMFERLRSLGTAAADGVSSRWPSSTRALALARHRGRRRRQLEMAEQHIVDDSAATLADPQRIQLGFP
jgi:hypothetical protein